MAKEDFKATAAGWVYENTNDAESAFDSRVSSLASLLSDLTESSRESGAKNERARLEAEISEARNEAATVRRAYLHEKKRAEDAIQWLRAYEPGPAGMLANRAYTGPAVAMTEAEARRKAAHAFCTNPDCGCT